MTERELWAAWRTWIVPATVMVAEALLLIVVIVLFL